MVDFLQPDGSFSYYRTHSCTSMQGCPSAVPNTREGDVNGYLIATFDMPRYILASLELYDDYNVYLYTEQDRVRYINAIREVEPTVKGSVTPSEVVKLDFEGDTVGTTNPSGVSIVLDNNRVLNDGAYVKVADDGTGNKVLEYNAKAKKVDNGRNYNVIINAGHEDIKPSVMRFEFRMKVNSVSGTSVTDFLIRAYDASATVMQVFLKADSSGNIYFAEANGTKVGNVGKVGQYFTFVLEYEWSKGEYRIYSNGNYVGKGTSTYGNTMHQTTGSLLINSSSGVTSNFYIDDIILKTYAPK